MAELNLPFNEKNYEVKQQAILTLGAVSMVKANTSKTLEIKRQ